MNKKQGITEYQISRDDLSALAYVLKNVHGASPCSVAVPVKIDLPEE